MQENKNVEKSGLYVVATPIGNLGDISMRAVDILRQAAVIACEDTRVARKLFSACNISAKPVLFNDHSGQESVDKILSIAAINIAALISDAGTPLLSDPGFTLVQTARQRQIPVYPIPGACAAIAALSVSGLPTDRFLFLGFPPPKQGKRRAFFMEVKGRMETMIIYESPHRILETLEDMLSVLGDRNIFLAREITKLHEEHLYGLTSTVLGTLSARETIKGEITLVISGSEALEQTSDNDAIECLKQLLPESSLKTAVENAAAITGLPKKKLYALALKITKGQP